MTSHGGSLALSSTPAASAAKSTASLQVVTIDDTPVEIHGYRTVPGRLLLYRVLCFLTLGVLPLVCRWFPSKRLRLTGVSTSLSDATLLLVVVNEWEDVVSVVTVDQQPAAEESPSRSSRRRTGDSDSVPLQSAASNLDIDSEVAAASADPAPVLRMACFRHARFFWSEKREAFVDAIEWSNVVLLPVAERTTGLDGTTRAYQERVFGSNIVDVPMKPISQLMMDEVLHPFYIFQVASMIIWLLDDYFFYAACIGLLSIIGVITSLVETRRNMTRLREMAHFECQVELLRDGAWETVASSALVPGDVFALPSDGSLPCDGVLLEGECIVNESMLTGEAIPVQKTPVSLIETDHGVRLPSNVRQAKKHIFFCGTKVIRARAPPGANGRVRCLVINTGFDTSKGNLVRSILFPKPNKFSFYRDSFLFVGFMAIIALVGFIYSLVNFLRLGVHWQKIALRALDIITVAVPPALPVAMTMGTAFSIQRLRTMRRIFCISPPRINVAGKVNIAVFDKTGTLTEEGLDVVGACVVVHPAGDSSSAARPVLSGLHKEYEALVEHVELQAREGSATSPLPQVLATCHSLAKVDGTIVGDPVDVKMFMFSQWQLADPPEDEQHCTGIIRPPAVDRFPKSWQNDKWVARQFEFDSALQRASVIVHSKGPNDDTAYELHVKGSPEMIRSLSNPATVPANFDEVLKGYTMNGYRVLALGSKPMPHIHSFDQIPRVLRHEAERDLQFDGLLVLENRLKPETTGAILELSTANIRCVMATGDNDLTAVSVARQCGILPGECPTYRPLCETDEHGNRSWTWENCDNPAQLLSTDDLLGDSAGASSVGSLLLSSMSSSLSPDSPSAAPRVVLTGADYALLCRDLPSALQRRRLLLMCPVFARMSPDLKQTLVEDLQAIGFTVSMCGDGANDCGALRAADVGVSLSSAEASVAAPFSSNMEHIGSVLCVIKEGRAALTTSLSCFKYMALYAMIQTVTVTLLYSIDSNLSDFMFLYIDLFLIMPLAVSMALTHASDTLARKSPTSKLISKSVLISILGHIAVQLVFQVAVFESVTLQSWFMPVEHGDGEEDNYDTDQTTSLFLLSSFQYIFATIVFSRGRPYRKSMFSNRWYIATLVVLTAWMMYMLWAPAPGVSSLFELVELPYAWCGALLGTAVVYLVVSIALEQVVFPWAARMVGKARRRFNGNKKKGRKLYKQLAQEDEDELR